MGEADGTTSRSCADVSRARRARLPSLDTLTCGLAILLALGAVVISACGNGDGNKSGGSRASSAIATGGSHGKGVTYEIRGPIRKVLDCGVRAPKLHRTERATSSLKLTGKKFTMSVGAASDLPGRYASYTGVLRRDGSFRLRSDYSSPGDIHQAVLSGRFTRTGAVTGTWLFGLPGTLANNLDDPHCRIIVSPLSSKFYFGIRRVAWRKAFGVR